MEIRFVKIELKETAPKEQINSETVTPRVNVILQSKIPRQVDCT